MAEATNTVDGSGVVEFDHDSMEWETWFMRFDAWIDGNLIKDVTRKRNLLISRLSLSTAKLLKSMSAPREVKTMTCEECTTILENHFNPRPNELTAVFSFQTRFQHKGEPIAEYIASLRSLAVDCSFGDNNALNRRLRDQLVVGVHSERHRQRCLGESTPTLKSITTLLQTLEKAEKDSKTISQAQTSAVVHTSETKRTPPAGMSAHAPRGRACGRCGSLDHDDSRCSWKDAECFKCGRPGHLKKMCRSPNPTKPKGGSGYRNRRGKRGNARQVQASSSDSDDSQVDITHVQVVATHQASPPIDTPKPYNVLMKVNDLPLKLELDTGCTLTLSSEEDWKNKLNSPTLRPTDLKVMAYGGRQVPALGVADVPVQCKGERKVLPLLVTEGKGSSLLGRNWMTAFGMDWKRMLTAESKYDIVEALCIQPKSMTDRVLSECKIAPDLPRHTREKLVNMLSEYVEVFDTSEQHAIQGFTGSLQLKPQARPVFFKARVPPFALKSKIEDDLDRLEKAGVIERVETSEWATPVVPIVKTDGSVRICGDFKVTVNPLLEIPDYPMPRHEDLFSLAGGNDRFTGADWSEAYLQLPLDDESQKVCVINTHKGLYRYKRLPFGIASSPAIFQKVVEQVIAGLPKTGALLDDVLISAADDEEHLSRLRALFERLKRYNVKLKAVKCEFMMRKVKYLGLHLSKEGVEPIPKKLDPILNMPEPKNISELRSFFGMLNMYNSFIHKFADLAGPLTELLSKKVPWDMTPERKESFLKLKEALTQAPVLAHYDPDLPLSLACDASAYGLGVILTQTHSDGRDRIVSYASKRMTTTQQNYAQIEKEGLSIVYGVKKFHRYLFGRKFTLITDHKPLVTIFGPKTGIPPISAMRLQRWAVLLMAYTFDVRYRNTKHHCDADALSRLPQTSDPEFDDEVLESEAASVVANQLQTRPANAADIAKATREDPGMRRLERFVRQGFPTEVRDSFKPYYARKDALSVDQGVVLWGMRVVVPSATRKEVLNALHEGHAGIETMKRLARVRVWWPTIDADIVTTVSTCPHCQRIAKLPPQDTTNVWPEAQPWERLHIDLADLEGKIYLVIVDSGSKWPEVYQLNRETSRAVIVAMRVLFAQNGLPSVIVSDNGTQFVSKEFEDWCLTNGIEHLTSPTYHAQTNGRAERFVQTFKRAIKGEPNKAPKLQQFLMRYRNTPHHTTNIAPAVALNGRLLRSRLDLLRPRPKPQSVEVDVKREFAVGDRVFVRDAHTKWLPGLVVKRRGKLLYDVDCGGRVSKRHINQMRKRMAEVEAGSDDELLFIPVPDEPDTPVVPADAPPAPDVPPEAVGAVPLPVDPTVAREVPRHLRTDYRLRQNARQAGSYRV